MPNASGDKKHQNRHWTKFGVRAKICSYVMVTKGSIRAWSMMIFATVGMELTSLVILLSMPCSYRVLKFCDFQSHLKVPPHVKMVVFTAITKASLAITFPPVRLD